MQTLFDPPPAQHHSPTSVAAAERIEPSAGSLRARVLVAIRGVEQKGLTDEEGIEATGLSPSTYRPRRIECVNAGLVRDSGRTRATKSGRQATIWIASNQ